MQQLFLRGLIITLVLNLLVKPATIFGVDVVMQNRIGSETYGIFYKILNFTFLFSMILDMGITNFMTRLIAQHPHLIRHYSNQLFTLRIVLAVFYIAWSTALFFVLGLGWEHWWILGLLLLHQININTVNYVRAYTGGLMRFGMDAVLSVMERSVYLVLGLLLLYTSLVQHLSLALFTGIFVGASLTSLIFALFVYFSIVGFPKWKWNTVFFKAIFKKSLPFALLVILMMLYMRLDAVLLGRIHPQGNLQAGYYGQAFRLLDACYMFGILFGSLLLPVFSRLLKEKGSVSGIMTNAFNILVGGGVLMVILTFGMIQPLFDAIYKDANETSYQAWIFLALSFIPICFTIVFGTLLTANGSLKQLNLISFLGLLIAISLNLLLIPSYGAVGTAIATFSTQFVVGILQWFVVRYKMKERLEPMAWTKLGALAVLMGLLLASKLYFDYSILIWVPLVLGTWTILIFGLKIIEIKVLLKLISKNKKAVEEPVIDILPE